MHAHYNIVKFTTVATVSFSSATYQYSEGIGDVHITITRSGNRESIAIILVASDHFQGTAAGIAGIRYQIIRSS